MTGSIALVTCAPFAEGEDAHVLSPALDALGMRSSCPVWGDPGEPVDLPAGEFVVTPSVPHAAALHDTARASLFFQYDQDAAARFAVAVARRL